MATDSVLQLLKERNWSALKQYLSEHRPQEAEDFFARAMLGLRRVDGVIDWKAVIVDLQKACELKPDEALYCINLAQALLDSKQVQEAYVVALRASRLASDSYPAMQKLVQTAVATQRWQVALDTLIKACAQLRAKNANLPEQYERLYRNLSVRWWEPLYVATIMLRLPEPEDFEFLRSTYQNQSFMQHFHRFQGGTENDVRKFITKAHFSPHQTRRIDWVVKDSQGNQLGLAAIVDIDWANRRGEFLLGFPEHKTNMTSLGASIAVLDFAFKRLGLMKMVSYVYSDNPRAQANTLHLGFTQEGVLRSHIACPKGRLDLFVNGLLNSDYAEHPLLRRLANRWVKKNYLTPCFT